MARSYVKLHTLAKEADVDLDEALVALWDAGLDYLDDEHPVVRPRDVRRARTALGLEDSKAQLNVEYWVARSGLSRDELTARVAEVGVSLSPRARRIPKNSLRRFRSLFGHQPGLVSGTPAEPIRLPPLEWETIGNCPVTVYLTEDDIKCIHDALVEDFMDSSDPISPAGVRDRSLLSSAAQRPQTSLGEHLKYPTAEMAAAALFHSVVLNHAFFNGNKRTGLVALLAMLDANGLVLTCSQEELFKFTIRVAQHAIIPANADQIADREVLHISRWVKANCRPITRGERPMKWHKLKAKLREFGCDYSPAPGVGNRLNIWRSIPRQRLPRLRSPKELRTQVAWAGDGTEADRNTIHKIRTDLQLDDAHDIDSTAFYEGATIDAFIIDYRRILRRLARL